MSSSEWQGAQDLVKSDVPFYALIMAAMMRARGQELEGLNDAFPGVAVEVDDRRPKVVGDTIEYGRP